MGGRHWLSYSTHQIGSKIHGPKLHMLSHSASYRITACSVRNRLRWSTMVPSRVDSVPRWRSWCMVTGRPNWDPTLLVEIAIEVSPRMFQLESRPSRPLAPRWAPKQTPSFLGRRESVGARDSRSSIYLARALSPRPQILFLPQLQVFASVALFLSRFPSRNQLLSLVQPQNQSK